LSTNKFLFIFSNIFYVQQIAFAPEKEHFLHLGIDENLMSNFIATISCKQTNKPLNKDYFFSQSIICCCIDWPIQTRSFDGFTQFNHPLLFKPLTK